MPKTQDPPTGDGKPTPLGASLEKVSDVLARGELLTSDEVSATQQARILVIEQQIKILKFAIEEGIERVDRAERRIKAVVTSAEKNLAELGYEDPGIAAESTQLRERDELSGEGEEVQPVPSSVGDDDGSDAERWDQVERSLAALYGIN